MKNRALSVFITALTLWVVGGVFSFLLGETMYNAAILGLKILVFIVGTVLVYLAFRLALRLWEES